ncbi:MAG: hypothetical protein NTY61_02695 [Candidatus Parcubacteria bacterium]|nr:hypothetical protein [Candidatus Parcubacteria bacterium]
MGWLFCSLFGKNQVAGICSHKTKRLSRVRIFGKIYFYTNSAKKPEYCAQCMANMAIRCAWCGETINVGDPITLYTPKKEFKVPDYAVRYKEELVGCLRFECAETGGDRAGFWVEPGKVDRVISPVEMAFETGEIVLCRDLHDPCQAIHIQN